LTINEIEKLIELEKQEILEFQEFAKRHNIPKEVVEAQVDFYLDTLNKLFEILKTIKD
jgi:predicted transcriptional regulator